MTEATELHVVSTDKESKPHRGGRVTGAIPVELTPKIVLINAMRAYYSLAVAYQRDEDYDEELLVKYLSEAVAIAIRLIEGKDDRN